MATEVRLPRLGRTMQEATIVEYRVSVGDQVKKGDCIFEIETDKATMEVESPAQGYVTHLLVGIGTALPVGRPVLILAGRDERVPDDFLDSLKRENLEPVRAVPVEDVTAPDLVYDQSRVPVGPPTEVKLGQTILLTQKQRITGQRMLKSKREIPCFYLTVEVDVTDCVQMRQRMNQRGDVKISYHDFIMCAVAAALRKFPIMTGRLEANIVKLPDSIDIGLAVTVPDGLVAPIIRNVDQKDVAHLAQETQNLIEKALKNRLIPADLEGGCITISNLGRFSVESFIPIVVPGQCSILGVGRITDTCLPDNAPLSVAEKPPIVVRKLMSLTLSVDHRIANGTYAAQFLDFVRKLLEDTATFT